MLQVPLATRLSTPQTEPLGQGLSGKFLELRIAPPLPFLPRQAGSPLVTATTEKAAVRFRVNAGCNREPAEFGVR
jgi:hypothetical protein